MLGREIERMLKADTSGHYQFVKWWRKENDFLDYDLVDKVDSTRKCTT